MPLGTTRRILHPCPTCKPVEYDGSHPIPMGSFANRSTQGKDRAHHSVSPRLSSSVAAVPRAEAPPAVSPRQWVFHRRHGLGHLVEESAEVGPGVVRVQFFALGYTERPAIAIPQIVREGDLTYGSLCELAARCGLPEDQIKPQPFVLPIESRTRTLNTKEVHPRPLLVTSEEKGWRPSSVFGKGRNLERERTRAVLSQEGLRLMGTGIMFGGDKDRDDIREVYRQYRAELRYINRLRGGGGWKPSPWVIAERRSIAWVPEAGYVGPGQRKLVGIAHLYEAGKSVAEIARALKIKHRTVERKLAKLRSYQRDREKSGGNPAKSCT